MTKSKKHNPCIRCGEDISYFCHSCMWSDAQKDLIAKLTSDEAIQKMTNTMNIETSALARGQELPYNVMKRILNMAIKEAKKE